jgi:hypothetical protein
MGDSEPEGATEAMIDDVEKRPGQRFPNEYREFIRSQNGLATWFGDVYIALYSIDRVVEHNEIRDHLSYQPELILIGSDGGGEAIAFDFRKHPPAVILVNMVSIHWSEAIFQAESFDRFMEQRRRGEELRWD